MFPTLPIIVAWHNSANFPKDCQHDLILHVLNTINKFKHFYFGLVSVAIICGNHNLFDCKNYAI